MNIKISLNGSGGELDSITINRVPQDSEKKAIAIWRAIEQQFKGTLLAEGDSIVIEEV